MNGNFDLTVTETINPRRYVGNYSVSVDAFNNTFTITISFTMQLLSTAQASSLSIKPDVYIRNDSIKYWYNHSDPDNPYSRIYEGDTIKLRRGAAPTNIGTHSKTFPLQPDGTTIETKDDLTGGDIFINIETSIYTAANLGVIKATNTFKKINNIWKYVSSWIKKNGIWKRCIVWKKINGVWKK